MQPDHTDTSFDPSFSHNTLNQLMESAAEGNRAAFDVLYKRTSKKMSRVCQRICGCPSQAEDIVQDAYVAAWLKIETYDARKSNPITWLSAIVRNRAIDWIRLRHIKYRELDLLSEDIIDQRPSVDQLLVVNDDLRHLHESLSSLSPDDERTLRDAFFSDYTYSQLASRRGVPEGTMKSSIRRGLMKLRLAMTFP